MISYEGIVYNRQLHSAHLSIVMPDLELMQSVAVHRERIAARRLVRREGISEATALERVLMASASSENLVALIEARAQQQLRITEIKRQKQTQAQQKHALKMQRKQIVQSQWCGWFDGSAHPNPGLCAIGAILLAPDGRRWEISRTIGYGNSSAAEYQALLALLELMRDQACRGAVVYGDSRVVIDDLHTETKKQARSLTEFRLHAQELMQHLPGLKIVWIPRVRNHEADALAASAIARQSQLTSAECGPILPNNRVKLEDSL